MIIAAFIVVALLASGALFVGIRGRNVSDHPVCRRCGFDLFGKPTDSTVCPECGADLARPRAVRIGHRARRKGWLAFAVVLVLLDLTAATLFIWVRTNNINLIEYEPMAWVLRQASSDKLEIRGPALDEIIRRDTSGELSPGQWPSITESAVAYESKSAKPWDTRWATLLMRARSGGHFDDNRWDQYLTTLIAQCGSVDSSRRNPALLELISDLSIGRSTELQWKHAVAAGLTCQGDQQLAWSQSWGDLIEAAHDKQKITDADWQRYAAQAWPGMFGFRVRSNVRHGDPVPYWIDCNRARAAKQSKLGCKLVDPRLSFDGLPPTKSNGSHQSMTSGMDGGSASGSSLDPVDFPPNVPDGIRPMHVSGSIEIGLRDKLYDDKSKPLATGKFSLAGSFVMQPATQPSVKIIHDPKLADAIRKSIKIDHVHPQEGDFAYTSVSVSVEGNPVGIGFDIYAVQDGHENKLSNLSCPAGTRGHSWGTGGQVKIHGPTVDFIFRSSPAAAASTTDTFEVWDGTIVFHNVPVEKP